MLTRCSPLALLAAMLLALLGIAPAQAAEGDPVCKIKGRVLVCEDPGDPPAPGDPPVPGDPPPGEEEPPPPVIPCVEGNCETVILTPCLFKTAPWTDCYWPYIPGGSPGVGQLPTEGEEGEAAQKAMAELRLPLPEIGSVPCTDTGCMGGVGLPVWLWVGNTWAPVTATAEISSGSITATARPLRVVWDLGDGTQIDCGQGTPYQVAFGLQESPTCGHVYQRTSADQPGQRYTLAADLVWDVQITGDVTMDFQVATRSVTYPAIGEYQSVITGRGGDTR